MPDSTYTLEDKPVVWLNEEIKTPPFSREARREAGYLLRQLQEGRRLGMLKSRPMPVIGPHCHELRITDQSGEWRVIYRLDSIAIVIAVVFKKTSRRTPFDVIETSRRRLRRYDHARSHEEAA